MEDATQPLGSTSRANLSPIPGGSRNLRNLPAIQHLKQQRQQQQLDLQRRHGIGNSQTSPIVSGNPARSSSGALTINTDPPSTIAGGRHRLTEMANRRRHDRKESQELLDRTVRSAPPGPAPLPIISPLSAADMDEESQRSEPVQADGNPSRGMMQRTASMESLDGVPSGVASPHAVGATQVLGPAPLEIQNEDILGDNASGRRAEQDVDYMEFRHSTTSGVGSSGVNKAVQDHVGGAESRKGDGAWVQTFSGDFIQVPERELRRVQKEEEERRRAREAAHQYAEMRRKSRVAQGGRVSTPRASTPSSRPGSAEVAWAQTALEDGNLQMEEDARHMHKAVRQVKHTFSIVFLFAYGLFAGVALMDVYVVDQRTGNLDFLSYYSPFTSGLRASYYVLVVAVMTDVVVRVSMEFMDNSFKWNRRTRTAKFRLAVMLIAYTLSFIAMLVGSKTEDIMNLRYDESSTWYNDASRLAAFNDELNRWYNINSTRFAGAIIGWMMALFEFLEVDHTTYEEALELRKAAVQSRR